MIAVFLMAAEMNVNPGALQGAEPAIAPIMEPIAHAQNPDPITQLQTQSCLRLKQGSTAEQELAQLKSELVTLNPAVLAFYARLSREEQGAQGSDLDIVARRILDSALKDCGPQGHSLDNAKAIDGQ